MAVILPLITQENVPYRIPDSSYMSTPPAITDLNYFISASRKVFLYKEDGKAATTVTVDFPAVDNLFRIGNDTGNNIFKTI